MTTTVIPASGSPTPAKGRHRSSPTPQAGVVLEVIEGPMDGLLLAADGDVVRLGRTLDNELALHADPLVSGHHARLQRTADPAVWVLEDLGSSNGTWFADGRLIAPHPVPAGAAFIVGQSVVRVRAWSGETSYTPAPEALAEERLRLLELLSAGTRQALGAATMLACRERRGYVSDRHLFLGVAMASADLPIFQRGQGPISFEILNEVLWRNAEWTGIDEWIENRVAEIPISNFFAVTLPLSPRVAASLTRAEAQALGRGRTAIELIDWLRATLVEPRDRVHQVLTRYQLQPRRLLEALGEVSGTPAGVPQEALSTAPMRRNDPAGTDSVHLQLAVSSGDRKLDHRAQELARRLYGLAALYHLAAPEDRRTAMQQLLQQEVAQVPADRRQPLLEHLRRLFPLDAGSTRDAAEVVNLHNQLEQLRHRVAELEQGARGPRSAGLPWHLIVEPLDEPALRQLSPIDRPRIEFLRELFQFSIMLERFVIGLVQGLTVQATSTSSLALPGHRLSIRAYVDDMAAGRPVRFEALQGYLADIEAWLVAGLAAYHEAPEVWFRKFWDKASPAAIENRFSGWAKKLGLQYVELWKDYKETVRKVHPELVTQLIQHEVRRIAQERQLKISQGRRS